MEEIREYEEPKRFDNRYCDRCSEYLCADCVDFYEVEFDVYENLYAERPDLKSVEVNRKGEIFCVWCYNQLVQKYHKQSSSNNSKEETNVK